MSFVTIEGFAPGATLPVSVTTPQGNFATTFSNLTSGTSTIPAGVKSAAVSVESGQANIDGITFNAGNIWSIGGYDGDWTSSAAHVVGITGGLAHIIYET